ncbi:MAG: hypothetical protein QM680_14185 [Luteolibacter sp.]
MASLFDGSIDPPPHYDAPLPEDLADFDDEWRAAHLDGYTITCGWPDTFLSDLARDPQPEPELFGDIKIIFP